MRLALQFCLQEPHASVVIVGARSPDEVEAHVAAAQAPVNEETWRELADAGFPAGGLRLERRC